MNNLLRTLLPMLLAGPLGLGTPANAATATEVADPRPAHRVVDLTGTLTADDVAHIDAAARRGLPRGELLVVVVHDLGGALPREAATALFNRLGIGGPQHRGVLLLAAIGDRHAEIVLGDGFARETTAVTDRVMRDVVVRHFKHGDAGAALRGGADALVADVLLAAPARAVDDGGGPDGGPWVLVLLLGGTFFIVLCVGVFAMGATGGGNGGGGSSSDGGSSSSSDGGSSSSSDSGSSSGSGSSGDW